MEFSAKCIDAGRSLYQDCVCGGPFAINDPPRLVKYLNSSISCC